MKIDIYHHITQEIKVVHQFPELVVKHEFPQPFLIQIAEKEEGGYQVKGGEFIYIVKDDNPDVGYQVQGIVVTDAEGNTIPDATYDIAVISDNPDAVTVIPDANDPTKGTIHFGNPGAANINVQVTLSDGVVIPAAIGAQFTVTLGDPAAISGGTIAFEGLTES